MKAALVVMLFAAAAYAQEQPANSACGPATARFDTETVAQPAPAQTEPGKGQVYVIEVFDRAVNQISRPTLRIGLDGTWMGANKGDSYMTFSVEPGEHHLCANWQSHWKHFAREAAFFGFTAEPGKIYYFRARVSELGGSGAANFPLDLERVNEDEGRYLVDSFPASVSHVKK